MLCTQEKFLPDCFEYNLPLARLFFSLSFWLCCFQSPVIWKFWGEKWEPAVPYSTWLTKILYFPHQKVWVSFPFSAKHEQVKICVCNYLCSMTFGYKRCYSSLTVLQTREIIDYGIFVLDSHYIYIYSFTSEIYPLLPK